MSVDQGAIDIWIRSQEYKSYKGISIDSNRQDITSVSDDIHNKLRSLTGNTDKPTRFAAVILCFSVADTFRSALLEYEYIGEKDGGCRCLCSQTVTYEQYIRNVKNGNIITVGNVCINKFPFSNDLVRIANARLQLLKKMKKEPIINIQGHIHNVSITAYSQMSKANMIYNVVNMFNVQKGMTPEEALECLYSYAHDK